jgi:hypothetical protein
MTGTPSAETIDEAVRLATRAPSVHNTQPWQWRYAAGTMDLFADQTRRLALEDPLGRSLFISCGAALDHFVVAMRARGWGSWVRRFPDPQIPSLLASIRFQKKPALERSVRWAGVIERRRSDRRPMSSWPVPDQQIEALRQVASEHGAVLEVLENAVDIHVWESLAASVIEHHESDTAYERELAKWSCVPPHSRSGVPADNLVADHASKWGPPSPERFPPGTLTSGPDEPSPPQAVPLLVTTSSEDPLSCLRAGEALSAVLLEATWRGLTTRIESQVVEVDAARRILEDRVLEDTRSAQLLIRVGWPVDDEEIPASPRRETSEVLKKRYQGVES